MGRNKTSWSNEAGGSESALKLKKAKRKKKGGKEETSHVWRHRQVIYAHECGVGTIINRGAAWAPIAAELLFTPLHSPAWAVSRGPVQIWHAYHNPSDLVPSPPMCVPAPRIPTWPGERPHPRIPRPRATRFGLHFRMLFPNLDSRY